MKVDFYRHNLIEEDVSSLAEVLASQFLTVGPLHRRFETEFARYCGAPFVRSVNSCTAALHLALDGLGIGPGDEVIVPAMTFIATATAVDHTGAVPVLCDVDPNTGLMTAETAAAKISEKTKALLPVHLYGNMADMRALADLATKHGLHMVEDAAHALESERDGIRPGTLSDAACYSFYATKNLTCGEGGAVSTRHESLADTISLTRLHGMSADGSKRYNVDYQHWDMKRMGWKYNMDEIHAALLLLQMDKIEARHQRRGQIVARYNQAFKGRSGITLVHAPGRSAHHLYTIRVAAEQRDPLLRYLQQNQIGVTVNYRALHQLTYFRETYGYQAGDFPAADEIGRTTISLPLYPSLSDAQIDYVCEQVIKGLAHNRKEDYINRGSTQINAD